MSKKILYLECRTGISGDMTVAALLDLGADREAMERMLQSLPVSGFRTEITRVVKAGLDCCDFSVILDEQHENHDHDMEYLHGHVHEHTHEHGHDHTHDHSHVHEHRTLPGILHILSHAEMTPSARKLAEKIFTILADAEAAAHGIPREQVHFHEVGAVDSIVDIAAAAVLMDSLSPDEVVITELCEGSGWVRCQHGVIPVPVPAVVNIARAEGLILRGINVEGELVTPTGAAIAAAVRTSEKLPERYRIRRVGIGAGKRRYERPSLLRAMILEAEEITQSDRIYKLESNIDDCSGEVLGFVMDRLLSAGARDVHYTPVFMKKNRPAYQLNVICDEEQIQLMEDIIFRETTTIGIRRMAMERTVMKRNIRTVTTSHGDVRIKECRHGEIVKGYPEYEDLKRISLESGCPWMQIYEEAMEAWNRQ